MIPPGSPVGAVMEGRHELVLGVERHLGPAGQGVAGLLGVDAHLRGQHDEGRLGRIADDRPVVGDGGVGAQRQAERQAVEVGRLLAGDAQDRARLLVTGAFDLEPVAAGQHRGRRHRVHRQRAGLVAVDDRRSAQGLDVGQRLDHGLGLGQPAGSGRQHGLHERRAGRSGWTAIAVEMHSRSRVVTSWPRAMPKIAITATASQAMSPNTLVMLSSSRCSGERVRFVAVTMPAIRPISVAWPVAVTTNAAVPRVTWVFWKTRFVRSPSGVSPSGRVAAVLRHRRALAGQRGLLHLQRRRGKDPPVRRDDVARLQQDDVARAPARSTRSPSTWPDRRTRACGTCSLARASTLARAFSSWFEPITTLNVTRPSTTTRWRPGRWRSWRRRRSAA